MPDLVIERARVDGHLVDIAISGERITTIAAHDHRHTAAHAFDADGATVIPGLHDHHIHLAALAARGHTTSLDDACTYDDVAEALRVADRRLPSGTWLRAAGARVVFTRHELDEIVGDRPARVQHRSGALWMLNSAALTATGIDSEDGQLFGADTVLRKRVPSVPLDFAAVGELLLCCGITGVTDLTPIMQRSDAELLVDVIPQTVTITGGLGLPDDAAPKLVRGPVKIVVADHDLPGLDALTEDITAAHQRHRAVAIHCVTREALVLTLAALDAAGSLHGDRIEHAAVAPNDLLPDMKRLGVTVVTQPALLCARGDDYIADVDPADVDDLWPCARFLEAGITVLAGSDAPFGPLDPWLAIATAQSRETASGVVVNADERVDFATALAMYSNGQRVEAGAPADLCVIREGRVAAVVCRGALHIV